MSSEPKNRSKRIHIGPKKKIALVCSGGATKAAAFHVGVALALYEYGFKFMGGTVPKNQEHRKPKPMEISLYVGSSAGSVISTYLAAGYSLENIFNSFLSRDPKNTLDPTPKPLPKLTYPKMFKLRKELAKEQLKQFLDLRKLVSQLMKGNWEYLVESRWLKTTGLFSTAGIEQYIREEVVLSNSFQDYLAEIFIVGTQLNHSKKIVFCKYSYEKPNAEEDCQYINDVSLSQAVAASVALPFIYTPYAINHSGKNEVEYIDGETRDTLSTHVAVDAGADLVIASYTHQPYHLNKDIGSLTKLGIPAILVQSIYLLIEQKINNYIRTKNEKSNAIDSVIKYCKQQGLSEHQDRIVQILEDELRHRQEVDTIYIHPRPNDHKMFTSENFSLSPKKLSEIVRSGFKAGLDTLRKYDFEDSQILETVDPKQKESLK